MVKTLCFHCRGFGFDPRSENYVTWHGQKNFLKNARCVETFRVPQCLVLLQQFNFHCCHLWTSQVTLVVKNLPANSGDARDTGSIPGSGRSPGEGNGNLLHPVFVPRKSHGQRSLVGPWGRKKSDTIKCTRMA